MKIRIAVKCPTIWHNFAGPLKSLSKNDEPDSNERNKKFVEYKV